MTLARPAESIAGDELIRIGFDMVQAGAGGRRSELLERLRLAQTAMASQITLGRSVQLSSVSGQAPPAE